MTYDLLGAVETLFAGLVVQKPLLDAAATRYAAKGAALAASDVAGILAAANTLNDNVALAGYVPTIQPDYPAALPAYPTGLPRFPDGYGGMQAPDGWCLTDGGQVVRP